jgi:hypothetical protein
MVEVVTEFLPMLPVAWDAFSVSSKLLQDYHQIFVFTHLSIRAKQK